MTMTDEKQADAFRLALRKFAPEIPDVAGSQLATHYALMLRWNRVHNLTRDTSPAGAAERHYADSWFGLGAFAAWAGCDASSLASTLGTVLDIGSGAGFPGIVAAIQWPDARIVLVESDRKKTSFLSRAIAELELSNVEVLATRAEAREISASTLLSRAAVSLERAASFDVWCQDDVVRAGLWMARENTSAWVARLEKLGWTAESRDIPRGSLLVTLRDAPQKLG